MSAIVHPLATPTTPLDYALIYARLGWHVFPAFGIRDGKCTCGALACKNPGKHPIGWLARRGQDDATTDPEQIRKWWTSAPDANVAIMLAPSGLVAIDIDPRNGGWDTIDDLEARHGAIASDVVQLTGGGGEHRLFSLPAALSAGLPGKLGPGVDVKRNGYIIAEPSTHASGKTYQWEASSSPLDGVIPSPLPDWMRGDFGGAAPQLLPVVSEPLSERDRDDLAAALAFLPSDDREDWVRVGMALHATSASTESFLLWDQWSQSSAKYDPVDTTRVWRSFRNKGLSGVTKATVFAMAQERGWVNCPPTPTPVPAATIVIAKAPAEPDAEAIPPPPGLLADFARWVDATARKPQPQFAVQSAIAFAATVLGRRYVSTERNWPSLYLLNIGKSASGKEHAKWAVEKALDACNLAHLVGPAGYTSDSGLLSALLRQPSHLTIIDEFGKSLEAASVKHNHRAQSTLRALMEVWGRCDGNIRPQGYSTFGASQADAARIAERTIRNPAITLLGMTTPETFFDSIGSAAARDGFLNRFLTVETDIGRQASRRAESIPLPAALIDWAARVREAGSKVVNPDTTPNLEPVAVCVPFAPAAATLFDAFDATCIGWMDEYEQYGLAEMFGRTREIAMRLSLIAAVASGAEKILDNHAHWAIEYAGYHARRTAERLRTSVADSEFEATKKQVLALLLRSSSDGMTVRDIAKGSRRFAALDKRAQENVLQSLQFLGQAAYVSATTMAGRKRNVWMAVDESADADTDSTYPAETET